MGLQAKYQGLHQWNFDLNENRDFVIWNNDRNMVNISERLREIASVDARLAGEDIIVKISKTADGIPVNGDSELARMGDLLQNLMKFIADPKVNRIFSSCLTPSSEI